MVFVCIINDRITLPQRSVLNTRRCSPHGGRDKNDCCCSKRRALIVGVFYRRCLLYPVLYAGAACLLGSVLYNCPIVCVGFKY